MSSSDSFEDLGDNSVIASKNVAKENPLQPREIFNFAKRILLALAILFVLAGIAYCIDGGDTGKDIFDISTRILTPLETLVIGFYFSKN